MRGYKGMRSENLMGVTFTSTHSLATARAGYYEGLERDTIREPNGGTCTSTHSWATARAEEDDGL